MKLESPLLLAAALAAVAPLASAQGPKPPGTFGVELVVEDIGPGLSDILTALLTQAAPPGVFVAPALQVSLGADITGDGLPEVIKVNGAENGTTWQTRTAPEMVVGIDPVLGAPIVFIPATAPAFGISVVSFVDFRFGLPPVIGAVIPAGLVDIPFQLLDNGAGRLYVAESIAGVVMTVAELTYAGGAPPLLTSAAVLTGVDAEFQDRMALVGGTISIAHSAGVDVFATPGLAFVGSIPMPVNGAGVPYVPFTNILAGLPGVFDMLLFAGQPGGGPGHTFITWSSALGIAGPTGGIDPGGAALRPASGFHEPVLTPIAGGSVTVTGLLDSLPLGIGLGAIFQVPVTPAGPLAPVVTPVAAPFGDPEAARGGLADPIGFQVSTAAADFFGAVTAGAFGPIGAVSPLVGLVGLLNPGDSPRPLAMSFAGLPTTDFALTTTIGAGSSNVVTVGPGPVIAVASAIPAAGGAASLGTVWTAPAAGGPLPAHFQQNAGLGAGVRLQAGLPFSLPPLTFAAIDTLGIPPMPITPLVSVPAPQAVAASVSAARTSHNFDVPGVPATFVTLHPSPGIAPPVAGVASIAKGITYGGPLAFYLGIGAFVTEFRSF